MEEICNPCKECTAPKRHLGCHSDCEEYIKWQEYHINRKKLVREDMYKKHTEAAIYERAKSERLCTKKWLGRKR